MPRIKVISLLEVLSALLGSISICHCLFLCKHVFALCVPSNIDFRGLMFALLVSVMCGERLFWGRAVRWGSTESMGAVGVSRSGGSPLGRVGDSTQEFFLLLFHRLP